MIFGLYLIVSGTIISIVLLWAAWSKLDLGLARPAFRKAEPWVLIFLLWSVAEWAVFIIWPVSADSLTVTDQLTLVEELIVGTALAPVAEELLFRGAMFSALLRRWGIRAAVIVPSVIWALLHFHFEWWEMTMLLGEGFLLAMIRWKSGSLYLPLAFHAAWNLLVTLDDRGLLGSAI